MNRDDIRKLIKQDPEAIIDLIEKLFARVEELERRLNKDSHNSNKPPSSDGLSRKERRALDRKSRKKRGGQNGHEGSQLKMTATPDMTKVHKAVTCNPCHACLDGVEVKGYKKRQVFDIPRMPMEVTEHQAEEKECPYCGTVATAEFPEGVTRPAQYGSRIKGFLTYLSQYQLIPYERISELVEDLCGMRISKGTIYNVNRQAYEAGAGTEQAIRELLKREPLLHADETGVFCNGSLKWLHVASTDGLTHYHIHDKRGKEAIDEIGIVPEYHGYLMHDFWRPYLSYDCSHVFCNAHLLRELKGIHEDYGQKWAAEMIELLVSMKKKVDARAIRLNSAAIDVFEEAYTRIIGKGLRVNPYRDDGTVRRGRKKKTKPRNLLERLRDYREGITGFANDFSIPFDNNQAERDLRMVKVQQKISGCFRSMEGGMFFARIRGYISTVKKQGANVFESLEGLFENRPFMPVCAE